jgi:hypothetical protein
MRTIRPTTVGIHALAILDGTFDVCPCLTRSISPSVHGLVHGIHARVHGAARAPHPLINGGTGALGLIGELLAELLRHVFDPSTGPSGLARYARPGLGAAGRGKQQRRPGADGQSQQQHSHPIPAAVTLDHDDAVIIIAVTCHLPLR